MVVPVRETFQSIINYMREHPSVEIIASDDPMRRAFGWTALSDTHPQQWSIPLTEFHNFCSEGGVSGQALRGMLSSTTGRRRVIDVLRRMAERAEGDDDERPVQEAIGQPPEPPPPPPVRSRFQIMDDFD